MRQFASRSAPLLHPKGRKISTQTPVGCEGATRSLTGDSCKSQLLSDWTRALDEVGGGSGGQNPGRMESQWRKWEGGDEGSGTCMCLREGKAAGMRLGGIEGPLLGDIVMAINKPDRKGGGEKGMKLQLMMDDGECDAMGGHPSLSRQ